MRHQAIYQTALLDTNTINDQYLDSWTRGTTIQRILCKFYSKTFHNNDPNNMFPLDGLGVSGLRGIRNANDNKPPISIEKGKQWNC